MECSRRQVGSADALLGAAGGTESLFPGSANSVLSEEGKTGAAISDEKRTANCVSCEVISFKRVYRSE